MSGNTQVDSPANQPAFERLEPRLLLAADLVGTFVPMPAQDALSPGGRVTATVEVANRGDTVAGRNSQVAVYLHRADQPFDPATASIAGCGRLKRNIVADGTVNVRIVTRLPADTKPGRHRLTAVVDAKDQVAETDELNNQVTNAGIIDVAAPFVDLQVARIKTAYAAVEIAGSQSKGELVITNHGTAKATGRFSVQFFVSKSGRRDGTEQLVGEHGVLNVRLAPGRTQRVKQLSLRLPEAPAAKDMTLFAVATPLKSQGLQPFEGADGQLRILSRADYLNETLGTLEFTQRTLKKKKRDYPSRIGQYSNDIYVVRTSRGTFTSSTGLTGQYRYLRKRELGRARLALSLDGSKAGKVVMSLHYGSWKKYRNVKDRRLEWVSVDDPTKTARAEIFRVPDRWITNPDRYIKSGFRLTRVNE